MGKTGGSSMSSSWFTALKRAFIYSPTKKNPKRITSGRDDLNHFEEGEDKDKGKRKWAIQRDAANRELVAYPRKTTRTTAEAVGIASSDVIEMAIATTTAAEAAVATARAALEALPLASKRPFPSTLDHQSATIIQTAFRGYLARRALWALKGVVSLQALIRGHNVRKRAEMTLQCIQALVRVQTHLRTQLSHEGHAKSDDSPSTGHVKRSIKEYLNGEPQDEQKEIEAILLERKDEVAHAQELSLASAFSQQIWSRDEDSAEKWMKRKLRDSPRRTSFDQRDYIKTIEIDTYGPYSGSVGSIPLPKRMPIQANSSSPRCPRNRPEISTGLVPSYMCSTESARARFQSQGNPRQRASTPEREVMIPTRKQLSFPAPETCARAYCPSRKSSSHTVVPRRSQGYWTPLTES